MQGFTLVDAPGSLQGAVLLARLASLDFTCQDALESMPGVVCSVLHVQQGLTGLDVLEQA